MDATEDLTNIQRVKEYFYGAQKAQDEGRPENQGGEGYEGICSGSATQRLEDGTEGQEPGAGQSDRNERVGPEQTGEAGRPQEEARERHPLDLLHSAATFTTASQGLSVPLRIRIFLKDGQFVNCLITIPWVQWMQQLFQFHGVIFEGGWIPADLIKLIAPVNEASDKPLPDNVVPIFRGE